MNNLFTQKEIKEILNKPIYVPNKYDSLIGMKDESNNKIHFYYNKVLDVICVKEIIISNLDK